MNFRSRLALIGQRIQKDDYSSVLQPGLADKLRTSMQRRVQEAERLETPDIAQPRDESTPGVKPSPAKVEAAKQSLTLPHREAARGVEGKNELYRTLANTPRAPGTSRTSNWLNAEQHVAEKEALQSKAKAGEKLDTQNKQVWQGYDKSRQDVLRPLIQSPTKTAESLSQQSAAKGYATKPEQWKQYALEAIGQKGDKGLNPAEKVGSQHAGAELHTPGSTEAAAKESITPKAKAPKMMAPLVAKDDHKDEPEKREEEAEETVEETIKKIRNALILTKSYMSHKENGPSPMGGGPSSPGGNHNG